MDWLLRFRSVVATVSDFGGVLSIPLTIWQLIWLYRKHPQGVIRVLIAVAFLVGIWVLRDQWRPIIVVLFYSPAEVGGYYGFQCVVAALGALWERRQINKAQRRSKLGQISGWLVIQTAWASYTIGGFVAFAPTVFELPYACNLLIAFMFGRIMLDRASRFELRLRRKEYYELALAGIVPEVS